MPNGQAVLFKNAEKLHVTCLYIGDIGLLRAELNGMFGLNISSSAIVELFQAATETGRSLHSEDRREVIDRIETLSTPQGWVIVARISPSPALLSERQYLWQLLMSSLHQLGVSDPQAYATQSAVIALPSATWLPHVTLASKGVEAPLCVNQTFSVQLGPLREHT